MEDIYVAYRVQLVGTAKQSNSQPCVDDLADNDDDLEDLQSSQPTTNTSWQHINAIASQPRVWVVGEYNKTRKKYYIIPNNSLLNHNENVDNQFLCALKRKKIKQRKTHIKQSINDNHYDGS